MSFIWHRLWQSALTLWLMSFLVFVVVYAIGNPIDILIGPQADAQERAQVIHALGLDLPLWQQYVEFVKHALQGDLGRSFVHGTSALKLVWASFPATLELALSALLIAVLLGIPLGLWAGLRPQSKSARLIMGASILGFSLPTFWVGLMLIMFFAVYLGWLPASGRGETIAIFGWPVSFLTLDGLRHLLLPALNLALFKLALVIRLTRAGAQESLQQDYVKYARARGLSPLRIVGVHVLKNILIPLMTVIGLEFGGLIAFSVVTESVFAWPGMGKLLIESINLLDRPVVVAYLLLVVSLFTFINLLVDLSYALLDPRVRVQTAGRPA